MSQPKQQATPTMGLEVQEEINLDASDVPAEPIEPKAASKSNKSSEPSPAAKDDDGVPYCPLHHCRMKRVSGGKKSSPTSYYACPVGKCDEKGQKINNGPAAIVPAQPQSCPRCSGPKKKVYCERDADSSTASAVILKCPDCGWKSNTLAVPQLAAAHFARRAAPPVENIGTR